ncbi:MAG: 4Fe-4S dicluster-binding protein [bacterium]
MKTDRYIEDKSSKVEIGIPIEGETGVIDFNKLRSGGFIKQRQKDLFTVRCRVPGGRLPVSKLKKIVEVAEKYGGDYVHLTIRMSLEIPYVNYKDFGVVVDELAEADQKIASCGPRVRVPRACSGCEYNPNGLVDTQQMTRLIDERYFGSPCPHKFKIDISGCPLDCMHSNEADLGLQGAIVPFWDPEGCIGCTLCAKACKEDAIHSDDEGRPMFRPEKCIGCADCIRVCPTSSWIESARGYTIRIGGKHGRHPLHGTIVAKCLPEDRVPALIEKTLEWYNGNVEKDEHPRIGTLLRKTGMESYMNSVKDILGEYAAQNPRIPEPIILHPEEEIE